MKTLDLIGDGATFSDDRAYRYLIWRTHSPLITFRPLLWCMLNPSIAGAADNDPTTTLTVNLGIRWGYGVHAAVNCNALVGTDPACLAGHPDPVGPENDDYIRAAIAWCNRQGGRIVIAWGDGGLPRQPAMLKLLAASNERLLCLGWNASGSPRFPRAIARTAQPVIWQP